MRLIIWILSLTCMILTDALAAEVSPSTLTFKAVEGGVNPASQTITFSKNGKRPLDWSCVDNAVWLTVSPTSGNLTSSSQVVVSVNAAGLAAGTYSATVQLRFNKGGNTSVPVTFTVEPAQAPVSKTVTLSWSPNTESDLVGYRLYMGKSTGSYGPAISVGNVTTYKVNNLESATTYYFVVTAYDKTGNESLPSNEVSTSIY